MLSNRKPTPLSPTSHGYSLLGIRKYQSVSHLPLKAKSLVWLSTIGSFNNGQQFITDAAKNTANHNRPSIKSSPTLIGYRFKNG